MTNEKAAIINEMLKVAPEIQKERFQSTEKVADRTATIASAMLGFTLTFRSSLVTPGSKDVICYHWLLYSAWFCLLAAITFSMFALMARSSALNNYIKSAAAGIRQIESPSWFYRQTFPLMLISLITSFLLFITFAILNGDH